MSSNILDEILAKAKLLKDAREKFQLAEQHWAKYQDPAFLTAAVEHLCEENKKLKGALDRISRTWCTAHPSDLKEYRRETALAALTDARESEAQFEKQWGKK